MLNNMLRRCAQVSLPCPHRICKSLMHWCCLYEHGCEVRSRDHSFGTLATTQAESLLRRLLGVHWHVHTLIALPELRRNPLSVHWQRQVVQAACKEPSIEV